MASPIFNHLGEVKGAVSISGPTIRMTETRLEELRIKGNAIVMKRHDNHTCLFLSK
ncbi:IclR family transcriptional regulator C-terminal domain-containing protein [Neobacillus niacini]|uniref:IclR family transcriptional regulator C-terminal domain-containing protein n=1 Tax=Neobacillus niacini TaxID=86668 RepID=UPI0021CB0A5C|nr:IclR family transcriptional regulator C-terminal domain-containing protein [Neobacillus niacini]MCM3764437.1 IclR family transcriptional regulator C-terminal domain-containing protein [Neobacillus niacini]